MTWLLGGIAWTCIGIGISRWVWNHFDADDIRTATGSGRLTPSQASVAFSILMAIGWPVFLLQAARAWGRG